jgi:hypothetical protein
MSTPSVKDHWREIRRVFTAAFASSFHFAIATVGADGEPHVTPIGSVVLTEPGRGFYFEEFPSRLPRNLRGDPRVSILGVNSSRVFWLRALLLGRFPSPPAIRLNGRVVGEPREVTAGELALWQRRVRRLRRLRGYALLWGRLRRVRDLEINTAEPVLLGPMTEGLWNERV